MQLVKKITPRTCGLDFETVQKSLLIKAAEVKTVDGQEITIPATYHPRLDLLKVVGIVTKATPGTTDKGDYLKLSGDFTAVNLVTGEVFKSGACILDDMITSSIGAALKNGATEVQFGVMLGAIHAPTAVVGYQWALTPLLETKETDQMAQLLALAGVDTTGSLKLTNEQAAQVAIENAAASSEPAKEAFADASAKGKKK